MQTCLARFTTGSSKIPGTLLPSGTFLSMNHHAQGERGNVPSRSLRVVYNDTDAQLLLECSIGEPDMRVYVVSEVVSEFQFDQSRSIYHFALLHKELS